jgi:hypothetical protein
LLSTRTEGGAATGAATVPPWSGEVVATREAASGSGPEPRSHAAREAARHSAPRAHVEPNRGADALRQTPNGPGSEWRMVTTLRLAGLLQEIPTSRLATPTVFVQCPLLR